MSDPYEILGLPPHADETALRHRYLELVRESPPDRDPERFAAVRAAYDAVREPARRLSTQLFNPSTSDTLDALANDLRARLRMNKLPLVALLALAERS